MVTSSAWNWTDITQPPTWHLGSGPKPHSHLPFCDFSFDSILFWVLSFSVKSHHCHQQRNMIIFLLSKCDSWCHFPSCIALFSANSYVSVCLLCYGESIRHKMGAYHVGASGSFREYGKTMAIYYSISRVDNSIFLIFCICLKSWIWNFMKSFLYMRRKSWLPLGSQRTRDLIFTLGSLSSFREKNLQMTFNCKGKTSITWADILEGMNCLIKASAANPISHGIHSLGHLCNWLTAFIFLNVLFYIGVNKAYVLLVLLIIFWDSSCKLGNKLRRQRILRLASKPSKVKFRLWDDDTFPPVGTL